MVRRKNTDVGAVRSERISLTAILTKVAAVRRVIESEKANLSSAGQQRLETALDVITTEARGLLSQVTAGVHANPGVLAIYGNPPSAGKGTVLAVTLKGTLGYVEHLKYERTTKPAGPYFHDFGSSDVLWMGELADGQRVILLANVNGKPLWGKG